MWRLYSLACYAAGMISPWFDRRVRAHLLLLGMLCDSGAVFLFVPLSSSQGVGMDCVIGLFPVFLGIPFQ